MKMAKYHQNACLFAIQGLQGNNLQYNINKIVIQKTKIKKKIVNRSMLNLVTHKNVNKK